MDEEVWVTVGHPDPGLNLGMRMMTFGQALDTLQFYRQGNGYTISVHANEYGHRGGLLIRQLCKAKGATNGRTN